LVKLIDNRSAFLYTDFEDEIGNEGRALAGLRRAG
jgi:hypothetical protein